MNALKRKMDEGTSETQDSIAQMRNAKKEFHVQLAETQKDIQKDMQKEMQALKQETQAFKQELQGQLAEIMQFLRSRPSA
jgi:uncharacterized protein YydD (DUF2326 family)